MRKIHRQPLRSGCGLRQRAREVARAASPAALSPRRVEASMEGWVYQQPDGSRQRFASGAVVKPGGPDGAVNIRFTALSNALGSVRRARCDEVTGLLPSG